MILSLFGTIQSSSDETRKSISYLGKEVKSLSDIWRDGVFTSQRKLDTVQAIADFENQLKSGQESITKYLDAVFSGKNANEAYALTMENATESAKKYVSENKNGIVSVSEYTNQQKALDSAMKVSTSSMIAAKVATVALNLAVTAGIVLLVAGFTKLINIQKEAKETANALYSEYETSIDTLRNTHNTIQTISEDYEKLSKGVNDLGENVSLTTEDYNKYNDIVNQIADMFPEMVKGYTDEGNAIIKLKGNIDALNDSYKESQSVMEANLRLNADKMYEGYKASTRPTNTFVWEDPSAGGQLDFAQTILDNIDNIEKLTKLFDELGDSGDFSVLTDFKEAIGLDGIFWSNEDVAKALKGNEQRILDYIKSLQTKLESETNKFRPTINALLKVDTDYTSLDKEIQDMISQLVGNLPEDIISKIEATNATDLVNKIVNLFKPLFAKDSPLTAAMADVFDMEELFKNGEIGEEAFRKAIENFKTILISFVDDPAVQKLLLDTFKFDIDTSKLDETTIKLKTTQIVIDGVVYSGEQLKKKQDELKDKGEQLSSTYNKLNSDISDLMSIQKAQSEGTILSTNQMIDLVNKYPELLGSIQSVEKGYILEKDAVNKLVKAKLLLLETNAKELIENKKNAYLAAGGYQAAIDNYTKQIDKGTFDPINISVFGDNAGQKAGKEFAEYLQAYLNAIDTGKLVADALDGGIKAGFTPDKLDPIKEAFEKFYSDLNYLVETDQISKTEYFSRLANEASKVYFGNKKYIEEEQKIRKELYQLQAELSDERIKDMEHEIAVLENMGNTEAEQIEVYRRMLLEIQSQIKKYQTLGLDVSNDKLQELEKQLMQIGQKIKDIQMTEMQEAKDSINELLSLTIQMLRKQKDLQKQAIQNQITALDESYQAEKNHLEKLDKLQQEQFDTQKFGLEQQKIYQDELYENQKKQIEDVQDAEKKASDAKIKSLEKEKDAYQEKINEQLKLLRAVKEEEDYGRTLESKQKGISIIQSEIADLAGDDSAAARKRRLELENELAEKMDDLNATQRDKEFERTEEGLQNELKRYNSVMDGKIEAIQTESDAREEAYKSELERLERAKEAYDKSHKEKLKQIEAEEQRWKVNHEIQLGLAADRYTESKKILEKQIKDIEDFLATEDKIRAEAMQLIEGRTDVFYRDLMNYNRLYGNGIDSEVTDKWNNAYTSLDKFNNGQNNVLSTLMTIGSQMNNLKNQAYDLANALANVNSQNSLVDSQINAIINQKLSGNQYVPNPKTYDEYADGGVNTYTGWAKVHGTPTSSETFFSAADSKKLFDFVHNNTLEGMIKKIMPISFNKDIVGSSQKIEIKMGDINIQGSVDQTNLKQIENMMEQQTDKIFKTFNKHLKMGKGQNLNLNGI